MCKAAGGFDKLKTMEDSDKQSIKAAATLKVAIDLKMAETAGVEISWAKP